MPEGVNCLGSTQSLQCTNLPLSSCCCILFAASGCNSASHPLSILSFLALYTAKLSHLDCFHASILSSAYLSDYQSCLCPAFLLERARQLQGWLLIINGLLSD